MFTPEHFKTVPKEREGLLVLFKGDESKGLSFLRTSVTKEVLPRVF